MEGVLSSVYPSLPLNLTEMTITVQHFTIMSSAKQTQLTAVLEKSMITSSVISSMSSSEFLPQNVNRLVSLTLAIGCEFMRVEPFSNSETMIWNMFFFKFVINLTRNSKIFQKVCDSLRPKIN